jgi:DNA gyrase subunit B
MCALLDRSAATRPPGAESAGRASFAGEIMSESVNTEAAGKPLPPETPAAAPTPADYTADSFSVLEGMAHIRKNPSMYIGGADEKGLHHLVWELVDNSIDEAMAGHCRNIHVAIHADGSVTVADDGRGIPVDINKATGKPALELALTKVGGGAKHDNKAYSASGGLHGMGLTCVNAVSAWLEAEITRGGHVHRQRYERGERKTDIERIGVRAGSGTKISFSPDRDIFCAKGEQPAPEFKFETIEARLKQQAYLNPGVSIRFDDERNGKSETFHFPEGIRDFVRDLNVGSEAVTSEVLYFHRSDAESGLQAEVALQWTGDFKEKIYSFANSIYTREGGTHLTGLRKALTRTIKGYMDRAGFIKDKEKDAITGEDVHEGLTAVLSCRVPGRTFESQTKVALTSPEAGGFVESLVNEKLGMLLDENPKLAQTIAKRVQEAAEGRRAAQKAREVLRKNALNGRGLPAKLADCQTRDRELAELFLVEGDSAGGSAKGGRDSRTQAILPLRGKILNVEKARIDRMLGHEEIQALITALGTGIGVSAGDGKESDTAFDLSKLRYGKVIIMTDADVDGSHIRTLLLTFFFRHMPALVENGNIFIAQPPLYGIEKKGKVVQYVLNDRKLREMLRELALEDVGLLVRGDPDKTLGGADLKELLKVLDGIESAAQIVSRRGFPWPKFLADHYDPAAWGAARRLLPTHWAMVERRDQFFHGEAEFAEFLKSRQAAGGELPVAGGVTETATVAAPHDTAPAGNGASGNGSAPGNGSANGSGAADGDGKTRPALHHAVLNECKQINDLFARMAEIGGLGLGPADYLLIRKERVSGEQEPTRFALSLKGGDKLHEVVNLAELPAVVGRLGGRGFDIKRYKGLGEMDKDQLRETTMEPARRTLLRVTMENAAEAERLFSTLMGKETDSRREYIEEHALEVRNLDV